MPIIDFDKFNLSDLPISEDDEFEFKSSLTPEEELKKKLECAISGFANSGGGYFVAGVDDKTGNVDGGIPIKIGRQDIRDWVDQFIHKVEPTPKYSIKLIDNPDGRGTIKANHAVLVVFVEESFVGPHMAPDKCYYIRAGAHTVKARHFIVDAIWAKRHYSKPRLTHVIRLKPKHQQIVELGIVALTDAPALKVTIEMRPLPSMLSKCEEHFPLEISVIDRENSFFMDLTTWLDATQKREKDFEVILSYLDINGNTYTYQTMITNIDQSVPQLIFQTFEEKVTNTLKSIEEKLSRTGKDFLM